MKVSRNDPCPCGSGKKYKACCMNRDLARERVKSIVGEEAFEAAEERARTHIGEQAVWEADVLVLGAALPSLVMVAADGIIVQSEILTQRAGTPEQRAEAIAQAVSAAGRTSGRLPERLHVREAEVAALLAPRLQARAVEVHTAPIPALDEALEAVVGQMTGSPMAARLTTPDTWRETGASREELADFHRAAAEFYRLAPWKRPEMQPPLLLETPGDEPWAASVMGDAGVAYGLALYSSVDDLVALLTADEPHLDPPPMEGYSLTVDLDRKDALSRGMQREIVAGGWTVAGPRAHPRLFALNPGERRVTAEHVRQATLCLRAVNAHARGLDAGAETGVRVSPLPLPNSVWEPDGDDAWDGEDDRLGYFLYTETAGPMCAGGPGADPEGALRAWDDHPPMKTAEEERLARLEAWLRTGPHSAAVREEDVQNARTWSEHLVAMAVPAGAVTEYDLRLFLYDLYVRKCDPSEEAVKAIRGSLALIFRFLEEQEGIYYPFAAAVLEELDEAARRAEADGNSLKETLSALSYEVYDDLDLRAMLHKRERIGGLVHWPDMMSGEVAQLDRELQRRWLLWYDEAVRTGITDLGELEEVLAARQLAWEHAPHPSHEGQTPAEVVRAYLASEQYLGQGLEADGRLMRRAGP
jgi:hypothetical protein